MSFCIKIFLFLLIAFSAYSQDECGNYPEYCDHPENYYNNEHCVSFSDHCRELKRGYEGDPYCWRYPEDDSCRKNPPIPSREEILQEPSVFDQNIPQPNENATLMEGEQTRRQIFKMALIQEMQKNPETYWAIEFASKGDKAYQYFENSKSDGMLGRDALRIISGIGFDVRGVGIDLPDFNELETLQHRKQERDFKDFQPQMGKIVDRASQITDLYFLCSSSEGFNCEAFHEHFRSAGIDGNGIAASLEKSFDFGYKNSSSFPIGKNSEYLQSTYPAEAAAVAIMQDVKNKDIEKQIEAFEKMVALQFEEMDKEAEKQEATRVAHIKANDPFYTGKESRLLHIENRGNFYKSELYKINRAILSTDENISMENLSKLLEEREKHEEALVRIGKAEKLYKHKKFTAEASAWIGAASAVAQTVGMPKEVVKLGEVAGVGMKIYDAGMSMIIGGALDPTGITAITQGVSALMSIFFDVKSAQEIMQDSLNRIEQNTEKILEKLDNVLKNQEKIFGKLDNISEDLDYMRGLMQANHREIIENFSNIQQRLNQIEVSMQVGFYTVLDDHRRQDVQSIMGEVYGYIKELSSNSDNFTCSNNSDVYCQAVEGIRSNARVLLGRMFQTFKTISEAGVTKDFSELTKTEIEEYLENPSIEDRLPFLHSMVNWLNETEKRWVLVGEQNNDYPPYYYVINRLLGESEDEVEELFRGKRDREGKKNERDTKEEEENRRLQSSVNEQVISNIISGESFILSLPENIAYPSYQDKIFSEYVNLSSLLPPEKTHLGYSMYDNHIDQMCQNISSIESLSNLMRDNLQKAWNIYQVYSYSISNFILDMDPPEVALKIKTANRESEKKVKETIRNHQQNRQSANLPIYYRYGVIDAYEFKRAERDFTGKSSYFNETFSSIVSKTLNRELKDWSDQNIMDYGYSKVVQEKKVREGVDCTRQGPPIKPEDRRTIELCIEECERGRITNKDLCVECKQIRTKMGPWGLNLKCESFEQEYFVSVTEGDREAFKKAQIKEWAWYPAYLYTHVINALNKDNLITDWMRARLAIDTMAKIGYGSYLDIHPELSVLNRIIKTLPARREPFPVDRYFDPKTKLFSYSESNQIVQFFQDVESTTDPADYAETMLNQVGYESEELSPFTFIHPKLFKCIEKREAQRDIISLYRGLVSQIEELIESVKEGALSNFEDMALVKSLYETDSPKLVLLLERFHHIVDQALKALINAHANEYRDRTSIRRITKNIISMEDDFFLLENDNLFSELFDSYGSDFNSFFNNYKSEIKCEDLPHTLREVQSIEINLLINEFESEFFPKLVREYQESLEGLAFQDQTRFSDEEKKLFQKFERKRYRYRNSTKSEQELVKGLFEREFLPAYLEQWRINNLSLMFHLPLPSEDLWRNQSPSLGLPELRREAVSKAELFEHLKPQNCLINTR